ncbi:unnamed protein product [Tuber melanosporum]|uniref:(Perigord truffle) hypothetical protein n=1 Tax=Tuber melanosporum (strain Mel28) TaxID=656061 RepID=D5GFJ2_TUBMM|nr:uncharacterized protein GSTUM_00006932001 [Tuber melanosporum]CAZ83285.1 unnamed protein product [Tuber melanosporum]
MPSRLSSPMLSLDINHIAKVDPRNVDNLFSMWTIFSKCAESLENGRRLENLSWRVWNRETFCCDDTTTPNTPVPVKKPKRQDSEISDLPELSTSVESVASECEFPKEPRSDAVNIRSSRPCLTRSDSSERYRGKEKHMTPVHLVKLMEDLDRSKSSAEDWISRRSFINTHISTDAEPSVPAQEATSMASVSPMSSTADRASPVGSESSKSSEQSSHSVVRGFSPGQVSSSYRSKTRMAPEPSPVKASVVPKKSKKMWIIGSSPSSVSDDETDMDHSFSINSCRDPQVSGLAEGLKIAGKKKRTSFRDEVATRTVYDEDTFSDDDENVSESAIEDDDDCSSDWESSTDSAQSSYTETAMFQRVESRPQLVTRRSLLSTLLHEPKRAPVLTNGGSRSTPAIRSRNTSPSGPSLAASPRKESSLISKAAAGVSHSKPIIVTTSNMHPPALSPRTTRRNMLATELTESLRKHLLWERQQKNTTASAVLKRRHTAHDVTKLNDYPQPNFMSGNKGNASKNNSWNHYFETHEYHVAGW